MACSRLFPPQLVGPGLDRLLVAVPESREVVCISPLCSYVLHTTSILVAVCYIDHLDPSPVDYYQVRFEVTCRGRNKLSSIICTSFIDASLLDTVSDVIVSSDSVCFRVNTQAQYVSQCFVAGRAFPAFHVRLRHHPFRQFVASQDTPQSQCCQEPTGFQ